MIRSFAIRIAVTVCLSAAIPRAIWAEDIAGDTATAADKSRDPAPDAASKNDAKDAPPKKVTLRSLLRSENPRERAAGIQFVVKKRISKAGPRLEEMAKTDSVPGIRRLACMAIGSLDLKEGMLTLRTVARKDPSQGVRDAAEQALARLGGTKEEAPAAQVLDKTTTEIAAPPAKIAKTKTKKECKNNRDCKGATVCKAGKCKEPEQPPPSRGPTTGWALEAAIIGFIGSAATMGLTVYAALEPADLLPSIPLAASATLLTVIVAPSIRSGSKSVRDKSDVPGSLTLRVIGWTCFGLHIGGSLALAAAIPFHWTKRTTDGEKWTPKMSWIMSNGAVGAASLLALSIEALIARHQAKRLIAKQKKRNESDFVQHITPPVNKNKPEAPDGVEKIQPPSKTGATPEKTVSIAPYLSPIVHQDGTAGAAFGIVGRF